MQSVFASSSAPPPSALPAVEYEVFLSFRGPDVRNTFADHLYTSLARSKIRTFRDEEELRKGEGIAHSLFRAIPECKIYIPILTQQYASSKWCLQELAQMVECWKLAMGHLILPIFYYVDPRDVRHQEGPYQEAFEQHDQKHGQQTVKEWKEALQEVGQMKGWHVTDSHGQGAVIEEILSEVESHLRSVYTLVTDELVGIDSHVEEVTKLLNVGSAEGKVMVGIHGMGGIGKSTISKAVYNEIGGQFDRSCFLEDVREGLTKSDGVLCLQNKVISSILKDDHQVKNVSEGINVIKERVCKHKVLLVFDDIDDKFEFNEILGKLGDFSLGSRFIFTTRYKRALDVIPNCRLYEPGEMSRPLSLQLFSKHAFGMDSPPDEDASISQEFVKVAAGLPLALKVIGSLLFRRERKFWEEKLIELQGIPSTTENKVQERLKISYNELTHNEKQIFLDIACFFIGSHKDLSYYMWSGCEFYPESGINTLIHRSLIKLDERNKFWMHDHIKDLGRAIVKEQDVQHPYNRSRIWSTDDALDMLRNGEGSARVEVLRIDVESRDDHERPLKSKEFVKLSGLRYLEVRYGRMMGNFGDIFPNIRCLRLHQCGLIPADVNMKKLVVLDLKGCTVENDWKGWSGIKAAGKLKAINLLDCYQLTRAPDLTTCTGLELINFEGCGKMQGGLRIDNFKNLKMLRLYGANITELIVKGGDIGKLQRLEEMDLRSTPRLKELPAGMENLSSLKILLLESEKRVSYRMEIPRLPRNLKRLTISTPSGVPNLLELKELESLSYLNASDPKIPGDLWRLPNLKVLTLKQSRVCGPLLQQEATSPAALPSSLTSLQVEDCAPLTQLPSLANLSNLTQLMLRGAVAVEIRGLGELRALKTMEIGRFPILRNLDGLENLLLLTTLFVGNCNKLVRLPSVANLVKLKDLTVYECPRLEEIQGLGDLGESLSRLEISSCPSLTNLDGLQHLAALEDFTFEEQLFGPYRKELLKQFADISGLVNLKRLKILRCQCLVEVPGLERLVLLESLTLIDCAIQQLPDLSGLKNLKRLDLNRCLHLIDAPMGMDRLESLQLIRMYDCCSITKLPNLSGLKNLETLNLSKCTELSAVEGIEGLESLTVLRVFGCTSMKELNLSGLKNLKNLNIDGCTRLTKVKGLKELEGLERLEMGKKMRARQLAKSAGRYGKGIASRVVGVSPAGGGGETTTTSLRKLATEGRSLLGEGAAESLRALKKFW